MVATTSKMAYEDLIRSGKDNTQNGRILAAITLFPTGITRRELGQVTGIELGAVSGRVNKLVELGQIEEAGTVKCDITGKTVGVLKPVIHNQLRLV